MRERKGKGLAWRSIAGEIAIIVLGVLIALGAQEVVKDIEDRRNMAKLLAALRAELGNDRARWEHIRASDRCSLQRLDAIEKWVVSAAPNAKLDTAYRLFLWNMHSSVWDMAKTSAVTSNIPLHERLTYATLYGAIDNWRQFLDEENANARTLSALLSAGDDPQNRRQVRYHIELARYFVSRRKLNYDYFFTRFDALGIQPDESQLTVRPVNDRLCAPLDGLER